MSPENKCPYSGNIHPSITLPAQKEKTRIGLEIFEDILVEFENFSDMDKDSMIELIYNKMQEAGINRVADQQLALMDCMRNILDTYIEDLIGGNLRNYKIDDTKIQTTENCLLDGIVHNLVLGLTEIVYLYILSRNVEFSNFKTSILRLMKASSNDVEEILKRNFSIPNFVNNSQIIPIQKNKTLKGEALNGCSFLYFTKNKELLDRLINILEDLYNKLDKIGMTFTFTETRDNVDNIVKK